MTMISIRSGARRRDLERLAQFLRRRLEVARERRRVSREMAELSHLPRHLLRDMGLEEFARPRERSLPPHWY
ncbi:hypothetical protein [Roseovarius sp.]|uniref:hypothetical protein n=1 Tax=Roseovarius sp. TaxID=1486281 RepID=UPI0032EF0AB3